MLSAWSEKCSEISLCFDQWKIIPQGITKKQCDHHLLAFATAAKDKCLTSCTSHKTVLVNSTSCSGYYSIGN